MKFAPWLTSLLLVSGGVACGAWADEIDQAFKAQNAPSQVKTEVDASVPAQSAQARQKVTERAQAIERQRAEEMQRLAARAPAATEAAPRAGSPAPAGAALASYVCSYKCSNYNFINTDKTSLTVTVRAASESAARDETARHAKSTCFDQTRRIYDTASASCRRQ